LRALRCLNVAPVGRLLKLGDVCLQKATVAAVTVRLAILLDEFVDKIDRRHRLGVLRKQTGESPETTNQKITKVKLNKQAIIHPFSDKFINKVDGRYCVGVNLIKRETKIIEFTLN